MPTLEGGVLADLLRTLAWSLGAESPRNILLSSSIPVRQESLEKPHFLRALQARKHGLASVLLYDAPALHPVDSVGHEHGGHAVGSEDHRLVLRQHTQPLAQRPLRLHVQPRTYFVEHDDGRVGGQGTSKRDALALPAREHPPALPYLRLPALRQGGDELVDPRQSRGPSDLLLRSVAPYAVGDVLGDRAVEQGRVLGDETDLGA